MVNDDDTTTARGIEPWLAEARATRMHQQSLALVIVWSAAEPHRIGEVALLGDEGGAGAARLLGRGGPRPDDPSPRLVFSRHRPARVEPGPPLQSRGISRKHLALMPSAEGIGFERLGQGWILHHEQRRDRGVLRPGETIAIEDQLVLFCTQRHLPFAPSHHLRAEQQGPFGRPDGDGIVGESEAVWALREQIAFAASSPAHVLIHGESGTGKELVAHAVHRWSSRASRALVARSAASFPETLIDAELFGNMRDYPNPGMALRPGLLGAADGTALFLDEIGELPVNLQAHLLRVLDSGGQYHRLGESAARESDFRLIAATNRSLSALKDDFAARFIVRIETPALAERREDIPLLCEHLLRQASSRAPELCARFSAPASSDSAGTGWFRFDPSFMDALVQHAYAVNIRELSEILWASLQQSEGRVLRRPRGMTARPVAAVPPAPRAEAGPRREPTTDEIRAALARHGGNRAKASLELGLTSRFALHRLLRKHRLDLANGDEVAQ